jgi:hypothetical protein
MNEEKQVQGQVEKGGFWWNEYFCEQGQGDQERWKGIGGDCGERV